MDPLLVGMTSTYQMTQGTIKTLILTAAPRTPTPLGYSNGYCGFFTGGLYFTPSDIEVFFETGKLLLKEKKNFETCR